MGGMAEQRRRSLRDEKLDMPSSVVVQEKRPKHSISREVDGGKTMVMLHNLVCKDVIWAITWYGLMCESRLDTFLLV